MTIEEVETAPIGTKIKSAILSIVCLGWLVGCEDNSNSPFSPMGRYDEIAYFTYEGHDYIRFGAGRTTSIVHNPDCECLSSD